MKSALFLACLAMSVSCFSQEIDDSKKNIKKGIIATKAGDLTPSTGRGYWLEVSAVKSSEGEVRLKFHGSGAPVAFYMEPGDSSLRVSFADGSIVFLVADKKNYTAPKVTKNYNTGTSTTSQYTFWSNEYVLNATNLALFKEKEIVNIGVSGHKTANSYTLDPEKKDFIRKALALIETTTL